MMDWQEHFALQGFDGLLRDETPLSRIKPSSMHSEAMR